MQYFQGDSEVRGQLRGHDLSSGGRQSLTYLCGLAAMCLWPSQTLRASDFSSVTQGGCVGIVRIERYI